MKNDSVARHETLRSQFAEVDSQLQKEYVHRVAHNAGRVELPYGVSRGPVRDWTESTLLKREFGKSKRHIPIRQLLQRAGATIRKLKPVFMMGPLSVAQFLRAESEAFDVVIFDEASQVMPEDALGAVARGKQLIVVGDPKQLPPTNFFKSMMEASDDDFETAMGDTESILDRCIG